MAFIDLMMLGVALTGGVAFAESLTLPQAVERAMARYPSVRVSQEQVSAAAAGIQLARTSYLPKADFLSQVNRATRNNVYGMLLPQATLPSISGPPLQENQMTNVWGTAVGFLVSWEPFDFGLRKAQVQAAEVTRRRAQAGVERTKLEVATLAADAYLTILAAQQTAVSAKATIARGQQLQTAVGALVKAELRPGVDAERTRAEIALAQTQLIQAEQAVAIGKATLAEFIGAKASEIEVQAGPLLGLPMEPPADPVTAQHPAVKEQQLAIEESKARLTALDRTWYPRFLLQGSTYARGTGAYPDFTTGGAASGLGPNIANWGIGFTMTFPLLEQPALRARKQMEVYRERSETARLEQINAELNGRVERARAALEGARNAARQAPVQLEAAKAVETQATARYKAGLATIVEVAEAQRLVAVAEVDESLAKLNIWRALLAMAVAGGDLTPFLEKVR
jgi:outer membrane protein